MSEGDIDIYDEACAEIRYALDAYAVAVVDLSQFHLFYPAFTGSSAGGSTSRSRTKKESTESLTSVGRDRSTPTEVPPRGGGSGDGSTVRGLSTRKGWKDSTDGVVSTAADDEEGYSRSRGSKRAKKTYALSDPTAPGRTPQVLYIPSGRRANSKASNAGLNDEVSHVRQSVGSSC